MAVIRGNAASVLYTMAAAAPNGITSQQKDQGFQLAPPSPPSDRPAAHLPTHLRPLTSEPPSRQLTLELRPGVPHPTPSVDEVLSCAAVTEDDCFVAPPGNAPSELSNTHREEHREDGSREDSQRGDIQRGDTGERAAGRSGGR